MTTNPYREYTLTKETKTPSDVYRYVLRENNYCPICEEEVTSTLRVHSVDPMYRRVYYENNPRYKLCHPLKRIVVKGFWWWRKHCPVEGIHHHVSCKKCKISWLIMAENQSEANPDIKETYL